MDSKLWIIWFVFVGLVIILALSAIPYALWTKSRCVYFRLVDTKGNPLPYKTIFGVYDQTAYVNSYAGSYGGQNVFERSRIDSYGGYHKIGKTNAEGIFKKRIIFLNYWGLCIKEGDKELIVFLHLFSNDKNFAQKPKDLPLDTNRNIMDSKWYKFNSEN